MNELDDDEHGNCRFALDVPFVLRILFFFSRSSSGPFRTSYRQRYPICSDFVWPVDFEDFICTLPVTTNAIISSLEVNIEEKKSM